MCEGTDCMRVSPLQTLYSRSMETKPASDEKTARVGRARMHESAGASFEARVQARVGVCRACRREGQPPRGTAHR